MDESSPRRMLLIEDDVDLCALMSEFFSQKYFLFSSSKQFEAEIAKIQLMSYNDGLSDRFSFQTVGNKSYLTKALVSTAKKLANSSAVNGFLTFEIQ